MTDSLSTMESLAGGAGHRVAGKTDAAIRLELEEGFVNGATREVAALEVPSPSLQKVIWKVSDSITNENRIKSNSVYLRRGRTER